MMAEPKPGSRQRPGQEPRPPRESDGWQILSYMLGGMILYGGIGWLVGHWTGISVLFPIGMILGIGLSSPDHLPVHQVLTWAAMTVVPTAGYPLAARPADCAMMTRP